MFQQQTARSRAHASRQQYHSDVESDDGRLASFQSDDIASHSPQHEVLLFSPSTQSQSDTSYSTTRARPDEREWDVVPAFSLRPTTTSSIDATTQHRSTSQASSRSSFGTGTTTSSSSASGQTRGSPRVGMNESLFPSHDGNGIFLADSLTLSEEGLPPSLYASAQIDRVWSDSSSFAYSSSERSSSLAPPRTRTRGHSNLSHASGSDHAPLSTEGSESGASESGRGSVGGSWALTEEALSNIPDADIPINLQSRERADSAVLTSSDESGDEEEEEVLGGSGYRLVGGGRRRQQRRRGGSRRRRQEEEEEMLARTPFAASAGLHKSSNSLSLHDTDDVYSSSRGSYPSPPPERVRSKRRHRHSGRYGGAKKSSTTSGSVRGGEAGRERELQYRLKEAERKEKYRREREEKEERERAEEKVFMGTLVGKLVEVDAETMKLVADVMNGASSLPTPTPSRSSSPIPFSYSTQREEWRGSNALSRYASSELGGNAAMFNLYEDDEDDDDSGMETETEGTTTRWVSTFIPPSEGDPSLSSSTANNTGTAARSVSTSSLPVYLSDSLSGLKPLSTRTRTRGGVLRRTSSYHSSGGSRNGQDDSGEELHDGQGHGQGHGHGNGNGGPWGGDFDSSLDQVIGYWRMILRRMRGVVDV